MFYQKYSFSSIKRATMQTDDFLNAEDVARYLNLGKNTVYQLAKTGKLASYHVGRKLKFTVEDVEAYVASTHHGATGGKTPDKPRKTAPVAKTEGPSLAEAASFGTLEGDPFVIAGGDIIADLIAGAFNALGMPASRIVNGSYTALVNLYAGEADAAIVHLYDQKTNSYNIPYALNLAPGSSVRIIRLYGRQQGLVVQEGNPKKLTTWGSLLKEGVHLSNRAKGSGARVLLDEKLRAMEARSEAIDGYDSHANVANAALKRVATGVADVAVGTEREAARHDGLDFIPLQTEWVDIVVAKRPRTRPYLRRLTEVLVDEDFRISTRALAPCDLSKMGVIVYES